MKKVCYIWMICVLTILCLSGCSSPVNETLEVKYQGEQEIANEKFKKETLHWVIDDESILEFDGEGKEHVGNSAKVVGLLPGKALITVTDENKEVGKYDVTVSLVAATEIIVSTNEIEITEGEEGHISYTLLPKDASDYGFEWQSADETVATVDSKGQIKANKVGQTTIIISNEDGLSEKCSVTVKQKKAYDRLSMRDRAFVDEFQKCIRSFKDPSSVTVTGVQDLNNHSYAVGVSAINGFGGAGSKSYLLVDGELADLGQYSFMTIWDSRYDLNLINEALKEYLNN